jgi:hypothetical protein
MSKWHRFLARHPPLPRLLQFIIMFQRSWLFPSSRQFSYPTQKFTSRSTPFKFPHYKTRVWFQSLVWIQLTAHGWWINSAVSPPPAS